MPTENSHQIFLDPEGLTTNEFYHGGISTGLPFDMQWSLVRIIRGMESAVIVRPWYAIEYGFFDPRQLRHSLETKAIGSLYFVGQINGATGHEEAAAHGMLARINAGLAAKGKEPWLPNLASLIIGVLMGDLITRGVQEPYRMFISRAEYRLSLRGGNADMRSTTIVGRYFAENRRLFYVKYLVCKIFGWAPRARPRPLCLAIAWTRSSHECSLAELLRRPGVTYEAINALGNGAWAPDYLNEDLGLTAQMAKLRFL